MADTPRFLAENFYNATLFSDHQLTGNEEQSGHEAFRVGTGRRQKHLNYWTPTSTNAEAWIEVQCDRVRAADMIVLDRGHNLDGEQVVLEGSNDDFTTTSTIFDVTLPSNIKAPARIDHHQGAKTEEGAWVRSFDLNSFKYWRLRIPAMGSGLKPKIVGLYLGLSWSPERMPHKPWDDEPRELQYDQVVSNTLWVGSGRVAQRRTGAQAPILIFVKDENEYQKIRYHIHSLFWKRKFMWIVHDQDRAERSVLAYAPPGTHGAPYTPQLANRLLTIRWIEHEPKPD